MKTNTAFVWSALIAVLDAVSLISFSATQFDVKDMIGVSFKKCFKSGLIKTKLSACFLNNFLYCFKHINCAILLYFLSGLQIGCWPTAKGYLLIVCMSMKWLNGLELASYIKERHARQARELRAAKIYPKLAIVQVKDDPVINTYVRLKRRYGGDIGVDVEIHTPKQKDAPELLNKLSNDKSVHGVIVQLPLADPSETDKIVNLVAPDQDGA